MNQAYYEPGDDTYTLIECLKEQRNYIDNLNPKIIIEIGCGSGIISAYLKDTLPNSCLLSTDINKKALQNTSSLVDTNLICTSLMENIKQECVDLVVFNPPYVETSENETDENDIRASYSGGKNGRKIIDLFIEQLSYVKCFYLLVIRVNKQEEVLDYISTKKYQTEIVYTRKIMGETIFIIRGTKNK
ncbi:HemK methyltransferase member 2 [Conglomerata obtusa]